MAPEQLRHEPLDRRTDVYAAAVVLWEALAGHRLFAGDNPAGIVHDIVNARVPPPSAVAPDVPRGLDAVVLRGIERDPSRRFQTALEMARALEEATGMATPAEVAECVLAIADDHLKHRAERIAGIEGAPEESLDVGTGPGMHLTSPDGRRLRADVPTVIITKNDRGEAELTQWDGPPSALEATGSSAYASDAALKTRASRRSTGIAVVAGAAVALAVASGAVYRGVASRFPTSRPTVVESMPPAATATPTSTPVSSSASTSTPAATTAVPSAAPRTPRHLAPPGAHFVKTRPPKPPAPSDSPLEHVLDVRE
jgi:serine/threonine protein kinase